MTKFGQNRVDSFETLFVGVTKVISDSKENLVMLNRKKYRKKTVEVR